MKPLDPHAKPEDSQPARKPGSALWLIYLDGRLSGTSLGSNADDVALNLRASMLGQGGSVPDIHVVNWDDAPVEDLVRGGLATVVTTLLQTIGAQQQMMAARQRGQH